MRSSRVVPRGVTSSAPASGVGATVSSPPGPDMIEAREMGPLEQTEIEERRLMVRACVDKLPNFLRQVVVLAYYQGLKYREVAEILGVPVGTVKSRLHTALIRLQETWTETPSLPEI